MTKKELAKAAFKGKRKNYEGLDESSYVFGYMEGFNKAKQLFFEELSTAPLNKIIDGINKLGEE